MAKTRTIHIGLSGAFLISQFIVKVTLCGREVVIFVDIV